MGYPVAVNVVELNVNPGRIDQGLLKRRPTCSLQSGLTGAAFGASGSIELSWRCAVFAARAAQQFVLAAADKKPGKEQQLQQAATFGTGR